MEEDLLGLLDDVDQRDAVVPYSYATQQQQPNTTTSLAVTTSPGRHMRDTNDDIASGTGRSNILALPPIPVPTTIAAAMEDSDFIVADIPFPSPVPSEAPPPVPQAKPSKTPRKCIVVPQRVINIVDIKFEEDPFHLALHGLLTAEQYKREVRDINIALHACRATMVDHALLMAGPAMLVSLIPWAIRGKQHKKLRRQIMERCTDGFNQRYPKLLMRWETRPEKCLTIWQREDIAEQTIG